MRFRVATSASGEIWGEERYGGSGGSSRQSQTKGHKHHYCRNYRSGRSRHSPRSFLRRWPSRGTLLPRSRFHRRCTGDPPGRSKSQPNTRQLPRSRRRRCTRQVAGLVELRDDTRGRRSRWCSPLPTHAERARPRARVRSASSEAAFQLNRSWPEAVDLITWEMSHPEGNVKRERGESSHRRRWTG